MKLIDDITSKSMTAAFKEENTAIIGLRAPNGEFLNSFHLDRETVEAMLKDPTVTGIQIHGAKNPGTPPKEITLVFTAVKPKSITADALSAGDPVIYADPPPCPTVCPDLNP